MIQKIFTLTPDDVKTVREIADAYGFTESRVIRSAIRALKGMKTEQKMKHMLDMNI